MIRVYDDADNVIETHEHVCKFKKSSAVNSLLTENLPFNASLACNPEKNYLTLTVGPDACERVAARANANSWKMMCCTSSVNNDVTVASLLHPFRR